MTPEFENLLTLLSSTDEANVRLGFQLARNYEAEFEAHFNCVRQEMEELFEFLMKYKAWDFDVPFYEIEHLSLGRKLIYENFTHLYFLGKPPIPHEIGKLKHLKYLDLGRNELKEIPQEIGVLQELEELVLFKNKLQKLPPSFGNLKRLKKLHLSENNLQTFPSCIAILEDLEELYLYQNKIQEIPIEIANLQKLTRLEIDDNHLQTIPNEIGKLQLLECLNLQNNPLKALPEELCQLKHTEIYIKNTPKEMYIPEKLKKMGTLVYD